MIIAPGMGGPGTTIRALGASMAHLPLRVPIGPVEPVTKDRVYVADHLGLAADALTAASRRWDRPPYQVTGNYLQQAVRYLEDVLPEVADFLAGYPELVAGVAGASANARGLSEAYLADHLPVVGGSDSTPLLLARATYSVRAAQDVLCGVGGDTRPDWAPGF